MPRQARVRTLLTAPGVAVRRLARRGRKEAPTTQSSEEKPTASAAATPEPEPELKPEPGAPAGPAAERPPVPPPPVLAAVTGPPAGPEAEPEPDPDPEPEPGIAELHPRAPREWNVWELDRVAREHEGADPARDEERSFVLMSLRAFASPDGTLPADFDGVVRESFGELLSEVR